MNSDQTAAKGRNAVRMAVQIAGGLLGGFVLAAAVQASDTWLQPERFAATPGAIVVLDLTHSEGFVGFQKAIEPEQVARARGRLGGAELKLGATMPTEQTLRFPVTMTRPGVAVVGVELKPRWRELEADKVEAFFQEIRAAEDLREAWMALPEPRRWRENTVKQAKTFVRVGEPAADERAWAEPLGLALEIVPERDPTILKEGDALPVRVWRNGKPLAGFVLAYISAGETREHVAVTDADGRATATLDTRGAWLVRGTDLRRATAADREWESDLTTMVVEVR